MIVLDTVSHLYQIGSSLDQLLFKADATAVAESSLRALAGRAAACAITIKATLRTLSGWVLQYILQILSHLKRPEPKSASLGQGIGPQPLLGDPFTVRPNAVERGCVVRFKPTPWHRRLPVKVKGH